MVRSPKELCPVRRAIRRMVTKAAFEAEMPVSVFLAANDLPRNSYYRTDEPSMQNLKRYCDACGTKPSDLFKSIGW